MTLSRRQFFTTLMIGGSAIAVSQFATTPVLAVKPAVFTGLVDGVAVAGHDPVAYFTEGKPVKGSKEHTLMYVGAEWRFSSADSKAKFMANPAAYAPQFGGYCAYAVSQGYTAKGEPDVWKIVDGKLYLNFSKGVQRRWERDIPGHIASGEKNWPKVLN